MQKQIKKLLREFNIDEFLKKIYNMVRDDFYLDSNGKVKTKIIDSDGNNISPDTRSGINIQLKRGAGFSDKVIIYLIDSFGLSTENAAKIYDMISFDLKKEMWVWATPEIIYIDFFEHNPNKYKIDMGEYSGDFTKILDIRKLNDFMAFMEWYGFSPGYDPHDDVRLDFYNYIDEEDYLYMQENLMDLIKYGDEGYN